MLNIVIAPNDVLSQQAKEVKRINKEILDLIEEMKVTLVNTTDPEGIGLAAPQVGKGLRLFIVKEDPKAPFSVFINPKIELLESNKKLQKKQKKSNVKLEGCLSLPSFWGTVQRAPKVTITFLDEHGKQQTKTYSGFFATILQHEYDHLEGTLFPKRVLEQSGQLYKSVKNDKGEDEFEPVDLY